MREAHRIDALTSLRFFAAAIIAVAHAGFWPGFEQFRFDLFNGGNAVSFFFVLSGFILAYTYNGMDAAGGYRAYIVARVARIWPVHLVMLVAYVGIIAPHLLRWGTQTDLLAFVANGLLLHSWVPYSDFFYSYNGVSWSISTELAFYVAFPLLLVLMKKDWRILPCVMAMILVIVLGLCFVLDLQRKPSPEHVSASALFYINPICRAVEFMAGMLTWKAFNASAKRRLPFGLMTVLEVGTLAALIAGMVGTHWLWNNHGADVRGGIIAWLAVSGCFPLMAILILVYARQEGAVSRALCTRPLVYLGEISFALYMFHQMVLRYFDVYHKAMLSHSPVMMYVIYWGVALAGSAGLYHCVEKPCRSYIRRIFSSSGSSKQMASA